MARGAERLTEALRVLGVYGQDLDADQVLDVLWLARRLPASATAPLNRGLRAAAASPAPPLVPGPDEAPGSGRPPVPEPDDQDLPDLTAPSLYAAARQAPAPGLRPLRPAQEPRPALPVRVPEDKALGDELELGRALRPLRRRRASRHRLEVDEERTAAQLAESRLPDVVQRPVQERWLHLVLLVDDGLSMLLWHRLGAELRTLLERLGAFATTRVHGLDTRVAHAPHLRARPFQQDSAPLPTSTVNDPSGRTLVLVVSDGMGAAWRHGALHELLSAWAARGPVALLHTLPPQMWESSGIHAERWQATTRRIGGANTSWEITDRVLPADLASFDGIPVPVLEPTPAALRDWSHLLASPGTTVELPLLALPSRYAAVTSSRDLHSAQHFRDAATPEAYRLAAHLAAVSPLSVPVMRLVQSAVPWTAHTSHLAEVFLGGLVRPYPAPVPGPLPAKHLVFDFPDATKSVLLDAVPQSELLRTGRNIGRRIEQLAGNSPDFPAWLAHPDGLAQLPGTHRPFTSVERRLLTRFGVSVETTGGTERVERTPPPSAGTDDWAPLTDDDPRRLGPYELLGRRKGRRTVLYRAVDVRPDQGGPAVLRVPRPDLPTANARLIDVEAEVLTRLAGRYAPVLRGTGLTERPPWLATAPITDADPLEAQPPRLSDIAGLAYQRGAAPFDKLAGLLVGWHLASALNICHLSGLVLGNFNADSVFVLRRTVVLADLSDCVVDGQYLGSGPVPTVEDNVRSLGELLHLISTDTGPVAPGLPEDMHQWQGDIWDRLRLLVLRCLDPDPAGRPSAGTVADVLAQYIALTRAPQDGAEPPPSAGNTASEQVPLDLPPAGERLGPVDRPLRLSRFGAARREDEARLARLRVPLRRSRRLTLLGAYHYSGRATTTAVLGSLLATVRGEPVLALDGAAVNGTLDAFLTDRNPATVQTVAALPPGASYADIRALTTHLPSGLEVAAHRTGHRSPNTAHAQEYARVLARTAPYYSFVLTDWSPLRLGRPAEAVLRLTDRLILCCGTADWFLDAAVRTLDGVRAAGHRRLADEAIVVVTEIEGSVGRAPSAGFVRRLGIDAGQVVLVPFDRSLRSPGFRDLGRLRAATTRAFLDLAALAVGDGTR
ncbi:SAV_2336 N-terminal domain-related protein [Streptomyces aurantiacus]|uniref:SAV_2336 N-terminal domain-related protein n=1 Tax=Streptomyces aurantiacus TaxID=47760 RepID=UPI0006E3E255|nr:SAV_2336 N-terminal domain-related protein [Streptomyces aurantiacus]